MLGWQKITPSPAIKPAPTFRSTSLKKHKLNRVTKGPRTIEEYGAYVVTDSDSKLRFD